MSHRGLTERDLVVVDELSLYLQLQSLTLVCLSSHTVTDPLV